MTVSRRAGNDTLDGGSGTDTGVYGGDQSSYTLQIGPKRDDHHASPPGGRLVPTRSSTWSSSTSPAATFDPFDLGMFAARRGLSPDDFESFIDSTSPISTAAPDAIGLNFWGTAFATGTTLEERSRRCLPAPRARALATLPAGHHEPANSPRRSTTTCWAAHPIRPAWTSGWVSSMSAMSAATSSSSRFLGGVQPGSPDRAYLDLKGRHRSVFRSATRECRTWTMHRGRRWRSMMARRQAPMPPSPPIDAYHANAPRSRHRRVPHARRRRPRGGVWGGVREGLQLAP